MIYARGGIRQDEGEGKTISPSVQKEIDEIRALPGSGAVQLDVKDFRRWKITPIINHKGG